MPEGTREIDASGGIVMPGMIDTHRHMWQTAMRGYGADWTLTQYFVWYYLEHGKKFRPRGHPRRQRARPPIESLDAGVTTTVDWSHGLQTVEHADAAVDALQSVPGRFVLAYGNIQAGPWEWSARPEFRDFVEPPVHAGERHARGSRWRSTSPVTPRSPRRAAFEVARELGVPVTTHAGVWGATNDDGIRLIYDNGFATPQTVYVHAATLSEDSYQRIAASGGSVSVSTESEQSAGQGYPPTWTLRNHDIPVSLSMDTSVWWSGDLFSAMRSTLGADRAREHLEAHAKGETVTNCHLRADQVVEWATRGGARALGLDAVVGSLEPGKKADVVLIKNDDSPVMFPVVNPYGHVAFQAQRGDVHTVLVDGRVVKHAGRLVGHRPGRRPAGRREHGRVPAVGARRAGLGRRHAPRCPAAGALQQPVPVHGLQQRQHAHLARALSSLVHPAGSAGPGPGSALATQTPAACPRPGVGGARPARRRAAAAGRPPPEARVRHGSSLHMHETCGSGNTCP